jgi:hypothetical protein
MRDKEDTGGDDVPGDILRLLGEDGFKITQLISSIHESGEWPTDVVEVAEIALKKRQKATKCSAHCTISLISHEAKIISRVQIERKIEVVLEEGQFEFRRVKGTKDAIRMLRIMDHMNTDP